MSYLKSRYAVVERTSPANFLLRLAHQALALLKVPLATETFPEMDELKEDQQKADNEDPPDINTADMSQHLDCVLRDQERKGSTPTRDLKCTRRNVESSRARRAARCHHATAKLPACLHYACVLGNG
jgi:hypothetical protein